MPIETSTRKTKIVCTLGPATFSIDMIRKLISAGMDVARLNLSHGDHAGHKQVIQSLRQAAQELRRQVGILADLAGPKIRLGEIAERLLEPGRQVVLVPGQHPSGDEIPVNYPFLYEDVAIGHRILLADGRVELQVIEKSDLGIRCQVVVGGLISSHKGVNLPTSDLRIPAFTEKDKQDLTFALEQQVDFVAMSFVRHEKDLIPLREMMSSQARPPLLIAKIEKPQALERLPQILAAVEGVMVARGDLGVEMPVEEVPVIQKRLIQEARRAGRVVITATQMLGSMVSNPRPSRAEVTDVANAVLDGTDAVMLSEETAVGQFPIEAVTVLERVCLYTEPQINTERYLLEETSELLPLSGGAISRAAVQLARDVRATAIVAATTSGGTARLVSRFRPQQTIVGLTSDPRTGRQLCLSWGVLPAQVPFAADVDELIAIARRWVADHHLLAPEDCFILTAGVPVQVAGRTNLIKIVEMAGVE